MRTPVTRRAFRVWQRNFDVYKRNWRNRVAFSVIEPFTWFLAIGLGLGGYVVLGGDLRYVDFVAPGLLAGSAMFSSGAEGAWASFARMEYQKTYDAIIVTPLSVEDVIGGEILWAATRSVESGLALLLVMAVFGVHLSLWTLAVLPLLFLQGLVFGSAGVLAASKVRSIDQLNHFQTLFMNPQFMFAGVFFPLTQLPAWVGGAAWLTPLNHGVSSVRAAIAGTPDAGTLVDVAWLTVAALLAGALALRSMRARLIT